MRLPDFLIIGAQKSGTTALFSLLSQHPEIYLPQRKEVQYFSNDALFSRGLGWYSNECFAGCGDDQVAGEASPQYMYSSKVAKRIRAELPDAKIIAILREPLARAWSHYRMTTRREQEHRGPVEAFRAAAQITESDLGAPERDRYIQFSTYSKVLPAYKEQFGTDRILILFQEDLNTRPTQTLQRAFAFLGVSSIELPNANRKVHQSGEIRYKFIARMLQHESPLRKVARFITPSRLRPALAFKLELWNVRPKRDTGMPQLLRDQYSDITRNETDYLTREFDVTPPWSTQSSLGPPI